MFPAPSQAVLTFSPDEDIDCAFSRLSAGVKMIIKNANFNVMQEACIEKARSPSNLVSNNLISNLVKVKTFNDLCLTLSNSAYWNFLDTRMMEAMVTASMVPAAQKSLENFKKTHFGKKLDKVIPRFVPVIPLKQNHTILDEVLDKDPRQLTIAELHKHHFYLETEVLKAGEGTLSYYKIMLGSVTIEWQIHVDFAYQVHLLLQKNKAILSSKGISYLSLQQSIKWNDLPVVWIGQELEKIGPIESITDKVQQQPYSLPEGYEWVHLHSATQLAEIREMSEGIDPLASTILHSLWYTHPKIKTLGIRSSTTKELECLVWGRPICINIKGKTLTLVERKYSSFLQASSSFLCLMHNIALKELMRQFQLDGISQAILELTILNPPRTPSSTEVLKPVVTTKQWYLYMLGDFPYSTPQTAGLRKITLKDIPSALATTNKYTSQFEIGIVFESEEEFSDWFLPPSLPTKGDISVVTYVVEDPITGNVTDMFSFRYITLKDEEPPKILGRVIAIVNTMTPAKQLITDLLLCAKQEQLLFISTKQYGLKKEVFETFSVLPSHIPSDLPSYHNSHLYFYNYNYPEVDEDNVVVFHYML